MNDDKPYQRYRYTVYVDDSSPLCGYSSQTVYGIENATIDNMFMIIDDQGKMTCFNWQRVRWYTREPIIDMEPTA